MPSINATFKVKSNLKGLSDLKRKLKAQESLVAEVGHFGSKSYDGGEETIAGISLINQQGTGKIPSRPYMDIALSSPAFLKKYRQSIDKIRKGESTIRKELPILGELLKDAMVQVIMNSTGLERNAPLTIELKGFDKPLIDSSSLVADIESRIVKDVSRPKEEGISKVAR